MATPIPILNLDTLAPVAFVMIDGKPYPLKGADQMSIVGYHFIRHHGARLDVLWATKVLSAEQQLELTALLERLTAEVLDAPAQVRAKLNQMQQFAVCEAFLALPLGSLRPAGATIPSETRRHSTGANTSRRSSASSAATPGAGSRASRSRSSGRAH